MVLLSGMFCDSKKLCVNFEHIMTGVASRQIYDCEKSICRTELRPCALSPKLNSLQKWSLCQGRIIYGVGCGGGG